MISLSILPAEVLALILSSASADALQLWLTGNRTLQRRVISVTRFLKLENGHIHHLKPLPKFVGLLPLLQELEIDRATNHTLFNYHTAVPIIRGLSSCLTKLVLSFHESAEIVFPTTTPFKRRYSKALSSPKKVKPPKTSDWSLRVAFPLLQTLSVEDKAGWTLEDFDNLPPTLTSLSTGNPYLSRVEEFAKMIPRSILHLTLFYASFTIIRAPFLSGLPRTLQTLDLTKKGSTDRVLNTFNSWNPQDREQTLQAFPPSLTLLRLLIGPSIPSDSLKDLPSGLKELLFEKSLTPRPLVLDGAFSKLEKLSCDLMASSQILALPPTLSQLEADILLDGEFGPDCWPPKLTELRSSDFRLFVPIIDLLPPSLLLLDVSRRHGTFSSSMVSRLPRSLLTLVISMKEVDQPLDYPPLLTSLEIGDATDSLLCERIPSSVTSLSLPYVMIPASKLKLLPPRLKSLVAANIFVDADFDPLGADELAQMDANFQLGRRQGIRELFDCPPKHASILALLPRSLIKLHNESNHESRWPSDTDWRLLPPELEEFRINTTMHLPATILPALSALPRLDIVCCALKDAKDEHIRHMPRRARLRSFTLFDSPLTLKSVEYMLPNFPYWRRDAYDIEVHVKAMTQALEKHMNDEDSSLYMQLAKADVALIQATTLQ